MIEARASYAAAYTYGVQTIAHGSGRLSLVSTLDASTQSTVAREEQPTSLGPTEAKSLELLHDDSHETVRAVLETTTSLIGAGRDHGRLVLISKAIACEQQRHLSLATLHDQLVCARDLEALDVVARLLTASNRRLCALVAEHRACCHVGQRAAVLVAHADRIHVMTDK